MFTDTRFGHPARTPGDRFAFWFYRPEPMPRSLDLTPPTVLALSAADAAVGQLQGLGHLVKDPQLLLGPYIRREAVASSRIEGTVTSLTDVLQAEVLLPSRSDDNVAEVERYVAATYRGLELIATLPITSRLVREVHHVLLSGVRGQERGPGELRRSSVWVRSATDNPETAAYVPPPAEEVPDLVADWERFVNDPPDLPVLVRAGLMHYQFETIHPFPDGNGRVGRLLIGLLLIQERRLDRPLLYLSGYLEARRREYYDRLQAVRERGEIQEWLQFFLTAVAHQARDAVQRAERLVRLREEYLQEAAVSRSRLSAVVDLLFTNPYITAGRVEREVGLTNQGAHNLLRQAERLGWISEAGRFGQGGRVYWVATDVRDVIEVTVPL